VNNGNNKFDVNIFSDKVKEIKENEEIRNNNKIALILEKICNESVITNEFLDSISIEEINRAQQEISYHGKTIKDMQKNTFLSELIIKAKCENTTEDNDFF